MNFRGMLGAACGLAIALPAWAHHSHGNYDTAAFTSLKGTVKEIHWTNPHSWIYLEVVNAEDQPEVWALEGGGITQLVRGGWNRGAINPGDTLSVRCHMLRDGSNGCLMGFVTLQDGVEKSFDGIAPPVREYRPK